MLKEPAGLATPEDDPNIPRPSFTADEWQTLQDYVDRLPYAPPETLVQLTNNEKVRETWGDLPRLDEDSASAAVEALQAMGFIEKFDTDADSQKNKALQGIYALEDKKFKPSYRVIQPGGEQTRKDAPKLPEIRGRAEQAEATRLLGKLASKTLGDGVAESTDRWTELLTFGLHKPRTYVHAKTTVDRAAKVSEGAEIQKANAKLDEWEQNRLWDIKITKTGKLRATLRDPQTYMENKAIATAEAERIATLRAEAAAATAARQQQQRDRRLGRMARNTPEDSGDGLDALTPPATRGRNPRPETHVVTEQELKEELWNDTLSYITTPNDDEPDGLHFDSMSVESIASRLRRRMRVRGIQERDIENLVARFAPAFHTKLIEDGIVVRKPAGTGTVSGDWIFNKTRDEILATYAEKQADDEATAENEGANTPEFEPTYTLGVPGHEVTVTYKELDDVDAAITAAIADYRRTLPAGTAWSEAQGQTEESIRITTALMAGSHLAATTDEILDALQTKKNREYVYAELFLPDFLDDVLEAANEDIAKYSETLANLSPELQAAAKADQGKIEWAIGQGAALEFMEDEFSTYDTPPTIDQKKKEELANLIYWRARTQPAPAH